MIFKLQKFTKKWSLILTIDVLFNGISLLVEYLFQTDSAKSVSPHSSSCSSSEVSPSTVNFNTQKIIAFKKD